MSMRHCLSDLNKIGWKEIEKFKVREVRSSLVDACWVYLVKREHAKS
jgi:hypothetical protein